MEEHQVLELLALVQCHLEDLGLVHLALKLHHLVADLEAP